MGGSIDAEQKQQIAGWNKRCGKLWLKYFAMVFVPMALLVFAFVQVLNYFLAATGPLVSGELAYGQPGYYEYQAAKDQSLILLAGLFILMAAHFYVCNRWYKKAVRTLGPPPGDSTKWNRWVFGKAKNT